MRRVRLTIDIEINDNGAINAYDSRLDGIIDTYSLLGVLYSVQESYSRNAMKITGF